MGGFVSESVRYRLRHPSRGTHMTPFTVLILVCSMSVDHAACQPDTAVNVVQGPKVESPLMCGLLGQSTIATTEVAPRPGEEYLKIVCKRATAPQETVGLAEAAE